MVPALEKHCNTEPTEKPNPELEQPGDFINPSPPNLYLRKMLDWDKIQLLRELEFLISFTKVIL